MANKKQFNIKSTQFEIWEDWVDWFRGKDQNWYEFTFFEIKYEDESHMGTKEFSLALIGVHFKVSWLYDPAKFAKATLGDGEEEADDAAAVTPVDPNQNPPTP